MSSINYDLKKIKAFIFDVDGVLSPSIIPMDAQGAPVRLLNVKDRYAIGKALKEGFQVGIITGAKTFPVRIYYENLGVKHLYMDSANKYVDFEDFLSSTGLEIDEVAFSGDDIPDLQIAKKVGLSVAPADAAYEIRGVAKYISQLKGGEGIAREIIEEVLRAQDLWL